ncbi:MAG: hypothetical protein MGF17_07685 [Trichodesmium sp. MAG_R04]|nr:hypothetical protein [Trichodesmium sp. MAG_R04]
MLGFRLEKLTTRKQVSMCFWERSPNSPQNYPWSRSIIIIWPLLQERSLILQHLTLL